MNFLEQAINAGFENQNERLNKKFPNWPFSENFYGTSPYEPDVWFKKGNKFILISYCGFQCADSPNYNKTLKQIPALNGKYLYLALIDDNNPIYETFTGTPPTEQLVADFIK